MDIQKLGSSAPKIGLSHLFISGSREDRLIFYRTQQKWSAPNSAKNEQTLIKLMYLVYLAIESTFVFAFTL